MRWGCICLAILAGAAIGSAIGRLAEDRSDERPAWWVRVNVVGDVPDQFAVAVGDWIEFYASEPSQNLGGEKDFGATASVRGVALERLAAVRPASFIGQALAPTTARGEPLALHVFLRASKPGKATVESSFSRSPSRKETRRFEVEVVSDRERLPVARGR
jgi:hypothetical protein